VSEEEIKNAVLKACSHPTRFKILELLMKRSQYLDDLAREVGIARSTLEDHIASLAEGRLVEKIMDKNAGKMYVMLTLSARPLVESLIGALDEYVIRLGLKPGVSKKAPSSTKQEESGERRELTILKRLSGFLKNLSLWHYASVAFLIPTLVAYFIATVTTMPSFERLVLVVVGSFFLLASVTCFKHVK
jgi:DNA-binding transcriptional ArsR family regulator